VLEVQVKAAGIEAAFAWATGAYSTLVTRWRTMTLAREFGMEFGKQKIECIVQDHIVPVPSVLEQPDRS
jgi:hypothetical protein